MDHIPNRSEDHGFSNDVHWFKIFGGGCKVHVYEHHISCVEHTP